MLSPFMWPKKDHCLQLKVFVCILCLIGGRIINLFVPIYNKLIGELGIPQFLTHIQI